MTKDNDESRGAFRNYRSNYRCVNCDGWEEEPGNENGPDGDWGTSDYQGDALYIA